MTRVTGAVCKTEVPFISQMRLVPSVTLRQTISGFPSRLKSPTAESRELRSSVGSGWVDCTVVPFITHSDSVPAFWSLTNRSI
jgi:hypothetical protein